MTRQPIESAPMDGTWIMGYKELHSTDWFPCHFICRWRDEFTFDMISGWQAEGHVDYITQSSVAAHPTHWMPLPTPPEV